MQLGDLSQNQSVVAQDVADQTVADQGPQGQHPGGHGQGEGPQAHDDGDYHGDHRLHTCTVGFVTNSVPSGPLM